ncbi:hypothetical protein TNCV_1844591 [Trichonephila clavipes]|nr:hypothetical protein TNCV_1844591 [Trichonephila clavipes]
MGITHSTNTGWLECFKKRNDIVLKYVLVEANQVLPTVTANQTSEISEYSHIGTLILKRRNELAKQMGITFSTNTGWLERFKKRNDIVQKDVRGEAVANYKRSNDHNYFESKGVCIRAN